MRTEIDYDLIQKTQIVEQIVSQYKEYYSLVDLQDIGFTERTAINKINKLTKKLGICNDHLMDAYYEINGTLHLIIVDIKKNKIKYTASFSEDEWMFKEELELFDDNYFIEH